VLNCVTPVPSDNCSAVAVVREDQKRLRAARSERLLKTPVKSIAQGFHDFDSAPRMSVVTPLLGRDGLVPTSPESAFDHRRQLLTSSSTWYVLRVGRGPFDGLARKQRAARSSSQGERGGNQHDEPYAARQRLLDDLLSDQPIVSLNR
jgi:hypothetical protein